MYWVVASKLGDTSIAEHRPQVGWCQYMRGAMVFMVSWQITKIAQCPMIGENWIMSTDINILVSIDRKVLFHKKLSLILIFKNKYFQTYGLQTMWNILNDG